MFSGVAFIWILVLLGLLRGVWVWYSVVVGGLLVACLLCFFVGDLFCLSWLLWLAWVWCNCVEVGYLLPVSC